MDKKAKGLATGVAALALVGGLSMIAASPALAASSQCNVVTNHCETAVLQANQASTGHYIRWKVIAGASTYGCSWRVKDVHSLAYVGYGRIGTFASKTGTITGLYGYYRLELYNCGTGAIGYIYNTT